MLPVILLTDYGRTDEFVGVLHLVVSRVAPGAPIVDLTHDIPPFDVTAGAMTLWRLAPWLAPGVVLAVIDPGVGTVRRPIAIEVDRAGGAPGVATPLFLVGPDNGLLVPAAHAAGGIAAAVAIDRPAGSFPVPSGAGTTFAGRDVFAPAAALLSGGSELGSLGPPIDPAGLVGAAVEEATVDGDVIHALVTWVDHYGNVQLNVVADGLPAELVVRLPGRAEPAVRRSSFAEIPPDGLGLVTDSYGRAALCVDRGSAAARLGLAAGDRVELHPAR
jgi:S-adenosyl-L-methionine hydrolase (adenosine-forming)